LAILSRSDNRWKDVPEVLPNGGIRRENLTIQIRILESKSRRYIQALIVIAPVNSQLFIAVSGFVGAGEK
jgi:hypothetical protein